MHICQQFKQYALLSFENCAQMITVFSFIFTFITVKTPNRPHIQWRARTGGKALDYAANCGTRETNRT